MNTESSITVLHKGIPPISAEALKFRDYLSPVKIGEIITRDQLAAVAGRPWPAFKGTLLTAFRHLLKEKGMIFHAIRNVGWRRANDGEITEGERGKLEHIRRTTRRSIERMKCVDYDKLSPDDQRQYNVTFTNMGCLALFADPKARERITGAVIANNAALPAAKTLELFKD